MRVKLASETRNTTRGFTLIELLVVIAIIALLSSVVLSSLNSARAKSRDATRKAQVKEIVKALNVYQLENNTYPTQNSVCLGLQDGQTCWGDRLVPGSTSLIQALAPYIKSIPTDPSPNRGWGDRYIYLNGNVAANCSGTDLRTGIFIAYDPEVPPPSGTCSYGFMACCPSGSTLCSSTGGYFCAVPVN